MRSNRWRILPVAGLLCISLMCCQKARPHSVTLTWQAPRAVPGASALTFNIYRSTTSGGQYVKLASGVPSPPFEDRLVNSGRSYFYVVTACDQGGRESGFSAEATATIP